MAYYTPFYQAPTNYMPNAQNGFTGQNNSFYSYPNQQGNVPQQNIAPNIAQNQQSDGMIWVLGKNEAESYPVAPNCQVILWDKNTPTLYVKSMSANNVPNLRVLDFVERSETIQNTSANDFKVEVDKFATKDDITALRDEFDDLRTMCDKLSEQSVEKVKTTAKKNKNEEE